MASLALPIALLLVAPLAVAIPLPDVLPVSLSLVIEGDDAFDGLLSGVRAGSGSEEDPYVISDWTIVQDRAWGILLRNTTKHVVIERVSIPVSGFVQARDCPSFFELEPEPDDRCQGLIGIKLQNASHVTIRDVDTDNRLYGVRVEDSTDVRLSDVEVRNTLASLGWGILVRDSRAIDVSGPLSNEAFLPLHVIDSRDVRVHDIDLDDGFVPRTGTTLERSAGIAVERVDGLDAPRLRLQDLALWAEAPSNATVRDSTFIRSAIGITPVGSWRDSRICGNTLVSSSIRAGHASNLTIDGNGFTGGSYGVLVGPADDLRIEGNSFSNVTSRALWVSGPNVLVRGNAFDGNAVAAFLPSPGSDARANWWGDASGPSGIGPGTGDALATRDGVSVAFDPWLTEDPEPTVGCA